MGDCHGSGSQTPASVAISDDADSHCAQLRFGPHCRVRHDHHDDYADVNWDADAQTHASVHPLLEVRDADQCGICHAMLLKAISRSPEAGINVTQSVVFMLLALESRKTCPEQNIVGSVCRMTPSCSSLLFCVVAVPWLVDDARRLFLQHAKHRVTSGSHGTHQRRYSLQKACSSSLLRRSLSIDWNLSSNLLSLPAPMLGSAQSCMLLR